MTFLLLLIFKVCGIERMRELSLRLTWQNVSALRQSDVAR